MRCSHSTQERVLDVGEPAVDRGAELGLPAQPRREGDVTDPEAEAAPQLGERAELVQLAQAVEPVAGRRARRDDEPGLLEIAEHARGPAGACGRVRDVERIHRLDLNRAVSRLAPQPCDEPVERGLVGPRADEEVADALPSLDLLEDVDERAAGRLRRSGAGARAPARPDACASHSSLCGAQLSSLSA